MTTPNKEIAVTKPITPIQQEKLEQHSIAKLTVLPDTSAHRHIQVNLMVDFGEPVSEDAAQDAFVNATGLFPSKVQMLDSIYPKSPTQGEDGKFLNPTPMLPCDDRFQQAMFTVPFVSDEAATRTQAASELSDLLGLDIRPEDIEFVGR